MDYSKFPNYTIDYDRGGDAIEEFDDEIVSLESIEMLPERSQWEQRRWMHVYNMKYCGTASYFTRNFDRDASKQFKFSAGDKVRIQNYRMGSIILREITR